MANVETHAGLTSRVGNGVVAGIAGGVVFGALLAMMGMFPMIAMLVGSTSAAVGALVHLVISVGLGALFALVVPVLATGATLGAGAVYGALWWVLGPLLIMPAWLGGSVFTVGNPQIMSLIGHVIFGVVVAAVLLGLRRRAHVA